MFRYKQLSEFNLYLILYTSYSHGYTLLQKRRTRMSQRPRHLPESLYLAGKGFVMSVATGLSGVLVHPIRGTKQEMCINRSHQTNSQYREMEINLISTSIARCSRMEYHCKCTICCRDI